MPTTRMQERLFAKEAAEVAATSLMLLCGLDVPLSWEKLKLSHSSSLVWDGSSSLTLSLQ